MDTVMSLEEIKEAFKGEWVLIEDPAFNSARQVIGGKVICHSKDRAEVNAKMAELTRAHHALKYIGGLPEGMDIVLRA